MAPWDVAVDVQYVGEGLLFVGYFVRCLWTGTAYVTTGGTVYRLGFNFGIHGVDPGDSSGFLVYMSIRDVTHGLSVGHALWARDAGTVPAQCGCDAVAGTYQPAQGYESNPAIEVQC
jgi:hypothetical protein